MLMVMILRIYTSDGDNVVLADGGGGGDGHAYSKRDDEDILRILRLCVGIEIFYLEYFFLFLFSHKYTRITTYKLPKCY